MAKVQTKHENDGARGKAGQSGSAAGGRQAWLEAGWAALEDAGPSGVRIEAIARELGLTKGSFYHHFKNKNALLDALLEGWRAHATEAVVERVLQAGGPYQQLRVLVHEAFAPIPFERLEGVVRVWAASDPRARAVVDAVDARRLSFVQELFEACGLPETRARVRTHAFYRMIIGDFMWRGTGGTAFSPTDRQTIFHMLTADLAAANGG